MLPVFAVNEWRDGDSTYLDKLNIKLRGQSNVRVYAPEEANIIGRSTKVGSREVTMSVGSWFQE